MTISTADSNLYLRLSQLNGQVEAVAADDEIPEHLLELRGEIRTAFSAAMNSWNQGKPTEAHAHADATENLLRRFLNALPTSKELLLRAEADIHSLTEGELDTLNAVLTEDCEELCEELYDEVDGEELAGLGKDIVTLDLAALPHMSQIDHGLPDWEDNLREAMEQLVQRKIARIRQAGDAAME